MNAERHDLLLLKNPKKIQILVDITPQSGLEILEFDVVRDLHGTEKNCQIEIFECVGEKKIALGLTAGRIILVQCVGQSNVLSVLSAFDLSFETHFNLSSKALKSLKFGASTFTRGV